MPNPTRLLSAFTFLGGFFLSSPVKADLIIDINNSLMQTIREFDTGSSVASREFAILQTAVYDAVNGIANQYQSYHVAPAAPAGSSQAAAAASAAYTVLSALYPSKEATFNATRNAQLSAISDTTSRNNGASWGSLVATTILNWRASDNADALVSYVAGGAAGDWRPTAPTFGAPDTPQWGGVTPWTLTSGSQFRPVTTIANPSYLTTPSYTSDYNEVFSLGKSDSLTRTEEETTSATFWSYNPGSQTAVGHWNSVAQTAVAGKANSLVDNARIFAALNTALADAAIVTSDAAYTYEFWRPIAAIREAANDGNPSTTPLVNWEPLITTPLSPEYISANAATAGAAANVLNYFLGSETSVVITSDAISSLSIYYPSFDSAAAEASLAGIYGGTNFRTSTVSGLNIGHKVGDNVVYNLFAPAPEPSTTVLALFALHILNRRRRPL